MLARGLPPLACDLHIAFEKESEMCSGRECDIIKWGDVLRDRKVAGVFSIMATRSANWAAAFVRRCSSFSIIHKFFQIKEEVSEP